MADNNMRRASVAGGIPWFGIGFVILVLGGLGLLFTPIPGKISRHIREIKGVSGKQRDIAEDQTMALQVEQRLRAEYEEKLKAELAALEPEKPVIETPDAPPPPPKPLPSMPQGNVTDVRKLGNGIPFETEVVFTEGDTALRERVDSDSYVAKYTLSLRLPKAAQAIDELEKGTPGLSKVLPGLAGLLPAAKVSPWYVSLYKNKSERVRKNANSLNELLSKHNVYDCNTILHLRAESGRKVFFMQAEMDVVADGSDGDRLSIMPDSVVSSTHYQPFTSYGWPKLTKTPNPMIAGWERRIVGGTREMKDPKTTADRKTWLADRISMLKRGISDLKARSYLIAEYDPFIVISVNLLTDRSDPYAPKVGDYAVVIHDGKAYPCIVGDGGPTFKVGEGSLRLAKEINPKATPYNRPVSDLSVSYVVFPGSREPKAGPPNYEEWRQRCHELLQEIGGLGSGYELHAWTDLLAKPEEPKPVEPKPEGVAADQAVPDEAAADNAPVDKTPTDKTAPATEN